MTAIDPQLPFGDVNVLVLTDVHSWVAGHSHQEPYLDADYGDVLAFYELLKEHCDEEENDLWFVSNGDWIHGTGLGIPGDPSSLVPLLEKMPWDAVNCGNHELYEASVVEYMTRPGGLVDWWGDRYVTSNVKRTKGGEPLGKRFKVLKGKKTNLLVFGFLYNLDNPCSLVVVEHVEQTVQEKWFQDALIHEEFGAVLVLAHMDLVDPLVTVIKNAIRKHTGDNMPIQFITGHTHYRGVASVDEMSTSVEAGKYLDTVGFVSFPNVDTVLKVGKENATAQFQYLFLDANKQVLEDTLRGTGLYTNNGHALSAFISKTRKKMGLLEEIGCAPQNFYINTTIDDEASIWGLYRDEVVPQMFFSHEDTEELTSIMFISKESWRYDILSENTLVVDDIWTVAPFNDTITYMGTFPGSMILQLNASMNEDQVSFVSIYLPNYILIGEIDDHDKNYKLYTHEFNAHSVEKALLQINRKANIEIEPTAYTSTIIWLSFVIENWACNGLLGELPDWFPTPDHVAQKLGKSDDDRAKRAISIALPMLFFLFLCVGLTCCWIWARYICSGHQPLNQEEMEGFEEGGDEGVGTLDDKDTDATLDITLDDADHEML